jgi:hypothetical protein
MVKDFDAWLYLRRHRLAGTTPPWLQDSTTPSQELGTLIHLALLEPWHYDDGHVVIPYHDSYATKAGRDAKAQAEAEAKDKGGFTVRAEHHWIVTELRRQFADVFGVLTPRDTEQEHYALIDWHECKGKVDILTSNILADLKSCSDWSRRDQTLMYEHYAVQLVHYADVAGYNGPLAVVWAETKAPYRLEVQYISGDDVARARSAHRIALSRYTQAEAPVTGKIRF